MSSDCYLINQAQSWFLIFQWNLQICTKLKSFLNRRALIHGKTSGHIMFESCWTIKELYKFKYYAVIMSLKGGISFLGFPIIPTMISTLDDTKRNGKVHQNQKGLIKCLRKSRSWKKVSGCVCFNDLSQGRTWGDPRCSAGTWHHLEWIVLSHSRCVQVYKPPLRSPVAVECAILSYHRTQSSIPGTNTHNTCLCFYLMGEHRQ